MITYFKSEFVSEAEKEFRKNLVIYIVTAIFYLIYSSIFLIWYLTLPYKSGQITTIKVCLYPVSVIFVIYSFIFIGIKIKRAYAYKRLCSNIAVGLKENNSAEFLGYDYTVSEKDGVEMKSLLFIEYNKFKKENYERRVYVFRDKDMPLLEKGQKVNFITQANILCEYEITQGE